MTSLIRSQLGGCGLSRALLRPAAVCVQKRFLSLHEYQSLTLMKEYGVSVPTFYPAMSKREAAYACSQIGDGADYVIKAQVLAGGRGLGYFKENNFNGGVHICPTADEVKKVASMMLGNTLITKQTGETGKPCNAVMITERFFLKREKYFAILMDRATMGPILIGSKVGGMNIEDIAHKHPEAIVKMPVDIKQGLSDAQAREFAEKLDFSSAQVDEAAQNIMGLYKLFMDRDCTMVEINPFAVTHDDRVIACDAKVNFDDNAEYRQKELFEQRDVSQEDPREVHASHYDLNYVGLDGSIGCMVNGAGLAMATMDIIKLHGGEPANFLDVGGGARKEQVVEAFRILQEDKQVKAILVNIFGGIMRCDTIALGIIAATQEVGLSKPLVVRLQGTMQKEAQDLIEDSGLRMLAINDLDVAAKKAVKMAEIMDLATKAGLSVDFDM
uniref:Succinate--CoA ligase [ADP-forming] subunit beta, mitochondrial n=1 Tax=Chromera velia CCMP2878 TaxID=1169474 RepID=A0A0G4HMV9_9ALVE|mmetsp:Transcript_17014/g.34522  ORF Transcript_17014/g.34522 Transcript_17014/m.34522 type:complete len:442 (-) Transcript_17014:242-1567(-)|eukprot:Cvel_7609.t1-p1 / transcript=Cvel_7609.t1 / gene=Cvel_7609 / organism=Chromera_velia_CCMP2878 / gene_product=Succinyl-CoA ligase [ADP-forming] subunit beta,, putative / transcript_product=Succinyl-CoA ligase [ADP-forming] subunit beta,, putative / location=Cvel_scaffold401:49782-58240(-) / protein_length=441 / sequence_SO=supercontig / SO=protein_coding / is_pseudo=false